MQISDFFIFFTSISQLFGMKSPSSSLSFSFPNNKKQPTITNRPDWCSLPPELLDIIFEKLLTNFVDAIRFKAVCRHFYRTLTIPPNSPPQLPWLMLPSKEPLTSTRFFSLSDMRHYALGGPGSWSGTCCGSSNGWLFMQEHKSCWLLNPRTRLTIGLPSLRSILPHVIAFHGLFDSLYKANREKLIVKGVLSCCPITNHEDCWVAIIVNLWLHAPRLAVFRFSQYTWTLMPGQTSYDDVVYFKGEFYAVDGYGKIGVCDLDVAVPFVEEIKGPEPFKVEKNYLVESSGELLLVRRFRGWSFDLEKMDSTVTFKILKQDQVSKEWIEVKTLDRQSLFLGHNQSLSVLASDYRGCRENCIYFTDNCFEGYAKGVAEPHDVGIFSLADGDIQPLPGYSYDDHFMAHPPVWVAPSPTIVEGPIMRETSYEYF